MKLLLKIIEFLKPLIMAFTKMNPSEIETVSEQHQDNSYYDKNKFNAALSNVQKNLDAYLRGKSSWPRGQINNRPFNSMIFCKKKSPITRKINTFKVYRYYTNKGLVFVKRVKINPAEYQEGWDTYCNVLVGVFCMYFGIGNTQYFNGTEYTANNQIKNIDSGFYNTDLFGFQVCTKGQAENYALNFGLALATWQPLIAITAAHIAVMLGPNKVIQAGFHTGIMSIEKGFGSKNMKKIVYYKLVKA